MQLEALINVEQAGEANEGERAGVENAGSEKIIQADLLILISKLNQIGQDLVKTYNTPKNKLLLTLCPLGRHRSYARELEIAEELQAINFFSYGSPEDFFIFISEKIGQLPSCKTILARELFACFVSEIGHYDELLDENLRHAGGPCIPDLDHIHYYHPKDLQQQMLFVVKQYFNMENSESNAAEQDGNRNRGAFHPPLRR